MIARNGPIGTQVAEIIRSRIYAGIYPRGSFLPGQRDLSEDLGVSRTSLREAISMLQGVGLVAAMPGKGVCVLDDSVEGDKYTFDLSSYSYSDIYQLRYVLEGFSVRLASSIINQEDLDFLQENLKLMTSAIESGELTLAAELDFDFHAKIVDISGNRAIADILRSDSRIIRQSQRLPFYQRGERNATFQEHGEVLAALATSDSLQAQDAMQRHIVKAAHRAGVHFPTGLEGT